MRLLQNRSGQFVPLTAMILFTSVLLMVAGMNIYRISKTKLQVQNLADAAALAVASMEAKAVNTVVDRNEWLNHMYGPGYRPNKNSLPNISDANGVSRKKEIAQPYANLVATINKAQRMFTVAYNNFLGADNKSASGGSGSASLAEILSEIDGLQDPRILSVWVYNNDSNKPSDQLVANTGAISMDVNSKLVAKMEPLKFKTEEITIRVDGKKSQTLTQLAGGPSSGAKEEQKVGWMHPIWNDPSNTLSVQVSKNSATEGHWGAGVTIVKAVPLFLFGVTTVKANSMAYVVNDAGVTTVQGSETAPPKIFRPTFYARLAYHS